MAANTFYTPEVLARTALGILQREIQLAATVNRDAETEFTGGRGTVVNIRRPATLTGNGARTYTQAARDAGTEIIFDNVEETTIPITIDTHLYKGVKLTDEDLTFELRDFAQQVLAPMVRVLVEAAEDMVATEMASIGDDLEIAADGGDLHMQIIEARRILNANFVPPGGRYLVVSPEVETMLLRDTENRLARYDATGQTGTPAIREAMIGRLYGFETFVSNAPALEGSAIAYSRDAFAFVNRAPASPQGAVFAQGVADNGFALRYLRDYDPRFLQDRAVVSTFAGVSTLDANRAVRLVVGT